LGCGKYPTEQISSVTDDGGNTWAAYPAGVVFQGAIWYAKADTGGFKNVTINFSPDAKSECKLVEFSSTGTWATDTTTTATGNNTTPTGGALTPAVTSELFFCVSTVNESPVQTLNWAGATDISTPNVGSGAYGRVGIAYLISADSSAQTCAWTIASGTFWGVATAAFKP
jgi:hypothetical protein